MWLPTVATSTAEEILACHEAAITVTLPKPLTSNSKAKGRFGKQDFRYVAEEDAYICPGGQRLVYHYVRPNTANSGPQALTSGANLQNPKTRSAGSAKPTAASHGQFHKRFYTAWTHNGHSRCFVIWQVGAENQ